MRDTSKIKTTQPRVAPSVLSADFLHLKQDVQRMLDAGADLLHLDIMDGNFVPNVTFGPDVVKALRRGFPDVYFDAHLMMMEPQDYVSVFADAGVDALTAHIERGDKAFQALHAIRARGLAAGLSLRPDTPIESLREALPLMDLVLIMSVEPGFGGQTMRPETLKKAIWLREQGFEGLISVDGGVTKDNAQLCIDAGIQQLVMGTGLFKAADPAAVVASIHQMVRQ